jgi:signal transduction histidine kinase
MYFVFSFSIFNILWLTIGLAGISIYVLLRIGILGEFFYTNPFFEFGVLLFISTPIGIVVTMLEGRIILKPICEMLNSMKKLAGGDFNVRIAYAGLLRPKELREFSDEFNTMAKELGSIEMLRSDFVNTFSHEFKTPIVSLRGFAKLLKENHLTPEEREEYLDIIIHESERLSALATNVLNLTKIENQTIITEKSTFDLSEQIRRAILMTESKWYQKCLDLEIDLEDVLFYGNSDLLNQIWVNVLDNAVKFSPLRGKLEVKLYALFDSVALSVRDYGCGMDQETQAHLFDKFYQADRSRSTEGNGLGMAIVNKIVSLHDGQISVESEPGKGTLVTLVLPKCKSQQSEALTQPR